MEKNTFQVSDNGGDDGGIAGICYGSGGDDGGAVVFL